MIKILLAFLTTLWCVVDRVSAFIVVSPPEFTRTALSASSATENTVALSLPKPLGLILEENEEGQAKGVFVLDFGESGSALEYADQLKGAALVQVQGQDVQALDFDSVMDQIINAPDTVDLEFVVKDGDEATAYDVGTEVTITVKDDGKDDLIIQAKVGDNLRKVMLDAGFEVYQGMKQKLGNCGGGGQCTFCAVDFLESDGWAERSEYEDKKLERLSPESRLACLNNIQGPATIRKTKR